MSTQMRRLRLQVVTAALADAFDVFRLLILGVSGCCSLQVG